MKQYTITRVQGKPDWAQIPALKVDVISWLPDAGIRMEQQIAYDEQAIYIRQRAWEKEIRAEIDEPLGSVCQDSCMEFFFSPVPEDSRYFNMELNLNGSMFLGFGHGRHDSTRLVPENHKELFDIQPQRLEDGWEICYKIPLEFLRVFYPDYTFESGKKIRANCYKCGDKTVQEHYIVWNPSTSPVPDYHRPVDFGEMCFA